jgi:protein associated with RNAse G/E
VLQPPAYGDVVVKNEEATIVLGRDACKEMGANQTSWHAKRYKKGWFVWSEPSNVQTFIKADGTTDYCLFPACGGVSSDNAANDGLARKAGCGRQ